ncbi:hypothetical protein RhiLY_10753 [Ceratobasidium sp. AG-Ba]|nr:hypothetical protein RhiLY_10753 [Ceratobasidium sp. AG-Ba]
MSESKDLGRGKRLITRTPGGNDFAKRVSDSDIARQKRARKKEIERQEAILAAEDLTDEDEEETPPRKKAKSTAEPSSKSKSKSKSKSAKSSKPSKSGAMSKKSLETIDEHDDPKDIEAGRSEQTRRNFLIEQIHGRDKMAISRLKTKETWELEYQWSKGKPKAPARTKDHPTLKPTAKTPMWKANSSLPKESSFDVLGSLVMALRAAQDQSEKAAQSTPVPAARKRDFFANGEGVQAKRSRIDTALNQDEPTAPIGLAGLGQPISKLAVPMSAPVESCVARADTLPDHSNPRNVSTTSTRTVNSTPPEDAEDDPDVIVLDARDAVDVGLEKTSKKTKKSSSEDKVSNKKLTRDYEGTENAMINQTLWNVISHLASEGFFPAVVEYERMIRKSWKDATRQLNVSIEKYAMDDGHISCVKERVNSYRSRTVGNIVSVCDSHFPKLKELSGRKLKKYVQALEDNFYMQPGAKPGKGFYKHPVLLRSIHKMCYIGKRPAGIWYPELFEITPLPTIAAVCSILQFHIHQHSTGEFKAVKAEMGLVGKSYASHLNNLETYQESVPPKCLKVQKRLHSGAMKLAGKEVLSDKKEAKRGGKLSREDFCAEDSESGNSDDEQARLKVSPHDRISSRGGDKKRKPRHASKRGSRSPRRAPEPDSDSSSDSDSDGASNSDAESSSGSGSGSDSSLDSSSDSSSHSDSESESESGSGSHSRSRKHSRSRSRSLSRSRSRSRHKSKRSSKLEKANTDIKPAAKPQLKFRTGSSATNHPEALPSPTHIPAVDVTSDPLLDQHHSRNHKQSPTVDSETSKPSSGNKESTDTSTHYQTAAHEESDPFSGPTASIANGLDHGSKDVNNNHTTGNVGVAATSTDSVGKIDIASPDETPNELQLQSVIPAEVVIQAHHETAITVPAPRMDTDQAAQPPESWATRSRTTRKSGDDTSERHESLGDSVKTKDTKKGRDKKPGTGSKPKNNAGKEGQSEATGRKTRKRVAEEGPDDHVSKPRVKRTRPA